jgi:hypothetical protein
MRKTIPQYTIFTCDCCGREQDDRKHKENLELYGVSPPGLAAFSVKLELPCTNPIGDMEVCYDCIVRLQEAIEGVQHRASAENVQEQLAMIYRSKS